jgi:predicted nucleic acid-binding protein
MCRFEKVRNSWLDDIDILIAGVAIENDFTLISNNQENILAKYQI